jgi:hypothetical protein
MEHRDRADDLEREADAAGEASERLEGEIEDARSDWEAKKSDQGTPGAVDEEAAGPHNLEGEDPATGEQKGEERQSELEDAAQAEAEAADEDA